MNVKVVQVYNSTSCDNIISLIDDPTVPAERADEKLHRRSTVRMGIRVVQRAVPAEEEGEQPGPPPHASVDKPFLLSDGRVELEASLERAVYSHGEPLLVNVAVHNNSSKTVRRIKVGSSGTVKINLDVPFPANQDYNSASLSTWLHDRVLRVRETILFSVRQVFVVQHVDVCMFSNGKFKNVVALINSREECPLGPGSSLSKTYTMSPAKGATKNWIALEDSFSKAGASLASTVNCASNSPEDRNVFAIYVSYYVKVKLLIGAMGGELALKLPFTLMHSNLDPDLVCLPPPVNTTPPPCPLKDSSNGGSTGSTRKKRVVEDEDVILRCDENEPT
uniref:Arrestin C-terminal-like domain-containing protein n=1 Tax=Timema tahoe TaxID=61484 RepID=A0A7R9FMN6_9NEOP|nr:unnamed protein product [Timema tahoe]